ncbi:MAG TPA: GMC oxidoreductase [Mycobacterium sp.]|jgi:choline dehydrogenase
MGAGYTIVVALMRPDSRGSVRLADAAPGTAPVIDPNYYTEPGDLDAVAAGLQATREIGEASALDRWRAEEVLPGAEVKTDENMRDYARRNLRSYSHYAGICRIGVADDGVVDTELRVLGIDGLRVADASVMPAPISANTNATVYAIAERAAALIRGKPHPPGPPSMTPRPARARDPLLSNWGRFVLAGHSGEFDPGGDFQFGEGVPEVG